MPLSGASCEPTPVTPGRGPCANSWIASLGLPSTVRSNVAPFTSVNRIAATGAGPYIQPEVQAQGSRAVALRHHWNPAVRAAGLAHRTPYSMRHSYAAFSIAAGVSLF